MDTCWRGIEYDLECHEADPRMICSWWAEDCYWSTWTCCHHGGGLRMGPQRVLKRNDEDLDPWVVAAMLFETVYVSMISVPRIKQQKNTQTVILDQLNGGNGWIYPVILRLLSSNFKKWVRNWPLNVATWRPAGDISGGMERWLCTGAISQIQDFWWMIGTYWNYPLVN